MDWKQIWSVPGHISPNNRSIRKIIKWNRFCSDCASSIQLWSNADGSDLKAGIWCIPLVWVIWEIVTWYSTDIWSLIQAVPKFHSKISSTSLEISCMEDILWTTGTVGFAGHTFKMSWPTKYSRKFNFYPSSTEKTWLSEFLPQLPMTSIYNTLINCTPNPLSCMGFTRMQKSDSGPTSAISYSTPWSNYSPKTRARHRAQVHAPHKRFFRNW